MHSQQPPGVVQNWSTLQCSKQNTEQCGYDHAPVTRGRMRAQFPLPHGPHPLLPHPPRKGARTARRQQGDMGGGRGRTETPGGEKGGERRRRQAAGAQKKKTQQTNAPEQGQTAETDGTRQEPGSAARGAGKGDTPGEESGEAGTNTAANRGGGGCGPSRPRRWDPMRSWWPCTPRVRGSCSARTACC